VTALTDDFERCCALLDVAAVLPPEQLGWDMRELVETVQDQELLAWTVRKVLPFLPDDRQASLEEVWAS
jgi:hypothetical protein